MGGSGLDRTDDFKKFCGSGMDSDWKISQSLISDTVSSEISDFTPCMHAQTYVLHGKHADKTDY